MAAASEESAMLMAVGPKDENTLWNATEDDRTAREKPIEGGARSEK